MKLGICSGNYLPVDSIRIEGCGGAVMLLPSSHLASDSTVFGGFGALSFEFFFSTSKSYAAFIELGGMGTGATADKMVGSPIYANGFTAAWGFRYFL